MAELKALMKSRTEQEYNKVLQYAVELSSEDITHLERGLNELFQIRHSVLLTPYNDWLLSLSQQGGKISFSTELSDFYVFMTSFSDSYVSYLAEHHPDILLISLLQAVSESLYQYTFFPPSPQFLNLRAIHYLIANKKVFNLEHFTKICIETASVCYGRLKLSENILLIKDLGAQANPLLEMLEAICSLDNFKQYKLSSQRRKCERKGLIKEAQEGEKLLQTAASRTENEFAFRCILSARKLLHILQQESNDPHVLTYAIQVAECHGRMQNPRRAMHFLYQFAYQQLWDDPLKLRGKVLEDLSKFMLALSSIAANYFKLAGKATNPTVMYGLAQKLWLEIIQIIEENNLNANLKIKCFP